MKNILVTGSAGFIGANLVMRLFKEMTEGTIIGLDNLNNYYDVSLKEYCLNELDTYHFQLTNSPRLSTLNSKQIINYQLSILNSQLKTLSLSSNSTLGTMLAFQILRKPMNASPLSPLNVTDGAEP